MHIQLGVSSNQYRCAQEFPAVEGVDPTVICLVRPSIGDQILLVRGENGWTFPSGKRKPKDQLLRGWSYRVLFEQLGITETHISLRCPSPFLGDRSTNDSHLVLAQIRLSTGRDLPANTCWVGSYGHLMARIGRMCISDPDRFDLVRDGVNSLYTKGEFSWHWGIYP